MGDGETYNVGELSLCNQVLCFGSNKLLLEGDQLGTGGLLVLEFLNLITNLGLLVTAGLDTALNVPNLFQDGAIVLEVLDKEIFLLANLGKDDTNLVADVGNGVVVGGLTPVGQLRGDREPFTAGSLVSGDGMILGFDQLVEFLGQLGLCGAAQGGDGEGVFGCCFGMVILLARADGKCAVHGGWREVARYGLVNAGLKW